MTLLDWRRRVAAKTLLDWRRRVAVMAPRANHGAVPVRAGERL